MLAITNSRGQECGHFFPESKTYVTTRDAQKSQIFIHPLHLGDIAIDISILKALARLDCEWIEMLILNFGKKPFRVNIKFNEFLIKSETINYDKKIQSTGINTMYANQKRLNLREFNTIPDMAQKRLA